MTSTGHGRRGLIGGAELFDADLEPWPQDPLSPLRSVVNDYYWGGGPTAVTEIPYAWISQPVQRQPTTAVNQVTVSQAEGNSGFATDRASIRLNGIGPESIAISSSTSADPGNLARFLVALQATPRPRQPILRINLYARTEVEALEVLHVQLGQRVRITGAPTHWPVGATNFVVEGIAHTIAADQRVVEWATSALIGLDPSEPGPWVRADASAITGSDIFAY